jgi:hypothetical protein
MSTGTRMRSAGTRKEAQIKARPSLLSNSLGVHTSDL